MACSYNYLCERRFISLRPGVSEIAVEVVVVKGGAGRGLAVAALQEEEPEKGTGSAGE